MEEYASLCEQFLMKKKDYTHDINNFVQFCEYESRYDIDSKEMNRWIMAADTRLVLDSLKYHVYETNKYKSKTTASRYMSVVGQLFEYVRYNSGIKVTNMFEEMQMDRTGNSYYIKELTYFINNCPELKGPTEALPLTNDEAEKLVEWSDLQLLATDEWNTELGYRKALAAIAIKLMIMYGVTYRELKNMKWEQYLESTGQVVLNGFTLRLPMKLYWQMRNWHRFCSESGIKKEFIFMDFSGKQWGDITSSSRIPDYIMAIIGNGSLTSILKYGITQLIKAGISETVIRKITGASDTLILSCAQETNESLTREVNKRLVTIDLYDRL